MGFALTFPQEKQRIGMIMMEVGGSARLDSDVWRAQLWCGSDGVEVVKCPNSFACGAACSHEIRGGKSWQLVLRGMVEARTSLREPTSLSTLLNLLVDGLS